MFEFSARDLRYCGTIALRVCRRYGAMHLLEDCTQEAEIEFWRCSVKDHGRSGNIRSWAGVYIAGAVAHYLRDHYFCGKGRHVPEPRNVVALPESPIQEAIMRIPEIPPPATDHILADQLLRCLGAPEKRAMLGLMGDETVKETAAKMGHATSTIMKLRKRAIAQLQGLAAAA